MAQTLQKHFPLWAAGDAIAHLDGIQPQLASWNAKSDPDQIRLQEYLDDIKRRLSIALLGRSGLFLHMNIALDGTERPASGKDLENYLYPVVMRLDWRRFVYVSETKSVGGISSLTVGTAASATQAATDGRWQGHSLHAGSGPTKSTWKAAIRQSLIDAGIQQLPPGPVAVMMAWRSAASRNWAEVWKPTGDAMGPVLGEPDPRNHFNPADDRIVQLHMHRIIDNAMMHDIDVGLWWRMA
jgi:hypothetical protein